MRIFGNIPAIRQWLQDVDASGAVSVLYYAHEGLTWKCIATPMGEGEWKVQRAVYTW